MQDVINFCRSCDSCQRTRISTQARSGELVPLPIPDRPWSVIGINFIVKLPLSSSFDSIFVITDHLTKGAHFIPCNESMDSHSLAHLFVQHFFRLHGFPDKIVSDRGPTFVSAFWRSVMSHLKISPAPSTAYHPDQSNLRDLYQAFCLSPPRRLGRLATYGRVHLQQFYLRFYQANTFFFLAGVPPKSK